MWNQLIFYHLCLYGFYYNLNKFRGDLKKTKSSLFGRNRTGPDILSLERSDIQTVPRKWEIKSVAEVARVRRHLSWWYIKAFSLLGEEFVVLVQLGGHHTSPSAQAEESRWRWVPVDQTAGCYFSQMRRQLEPIPGSDKSLEVDEVLSRGSGSQLRQEWWRMSLSIQRKEEDFLATRRLCWLKFSSSKGVSLRVSRRV